MKIAAVMLAAAVLACAQPEEFLGARLQRTATLLATSTAKLHRPVRVLLYGQSITAGKLFSDALQKRLSERFPHADLTFENRAIGGFSASHLIRSAVHDVYPFYPDLVIFHVYGGERTGEVERLIANIRRYTTAEILIHNHHVRRGGPVDDPDYFRWLAQKYDCELADVSAEWQAHLKEKNLEPPALLTDDVHHNQAGADLLADLLMRHIRYSPIFRTSWVDRVRTYEAARPLDEGARDEIHLDGDWRLDRGGVVAEKAGARLRLTFQGNRVDVIAAHVKGSAGRGSMRVLIDGRPPSEYPELYAATRPSVLGRLFPGIRRVTLRGRPRVEDWTLKLEELNETGDRYRFTLTGSVTGPDGEGREGADFTSNSGVIGIEARDFTMARTWNDFRESIAPGSEIRWSVRPMFVDVWQAPEPAESSRIYRSTLAQGLTNGEHTVELIANGDGPVAIEALEVHRPPLR